jgi:hypothetical protein
MKLNQFVFDSENKEFVIITNGTEDADKNLIPTEATALRYLGLNNGLPVLAFTYRKVTASSLSPTKCSNHITPILEGNIGKNSTHEFIGRV